MSRTVAGVVRNARGQRDLVIHRSGSLITFEVDDKPRYKIQARNVHLAREVEDRCVWWLSRRDFGSFDELHEHVVLELDRARACAARMQRGSVYRTGPGGATDV